MARITWLPHPIIQGAPAPYQHAADESGRQVAMIRELANSTMWRVSLYPDGNPNHSIEGRAANEKQAKAFAERWFAARP